MRTDAAMVDESIAKNFDFILNLQFIVDIEDQNNSSPRT